MKDAITQLEGARKRYSAALKNIGEPAVAIPLEYLGVVKAGTDDATVYISIKDLTALVRSVLAN